MGSYDTVHAGDRCGQTKALGKNQRGLVPGDAVQLFPAPMDDAEFQAWLADELPARPERDFAVQMYEGGAVIVADGVLVRWADEVPAGVPVFDGTGYPVSETGPADANAAAESAAAARDCPACTAVRHGKVAEYRADLAAQQQAVREANANRRADRARAQFKVV